MDTYADNRTDTQTSGTTNIAMTHAEQNLQFLQAAIPSNEKFYVWAYADDGHVIATSCPEAEQDLFHHAFCIFGGVEKALSCAVSRKDRPSLIGSPIGMQWAVTFETARKDNLFFVIGPVFYTPPTEAQLREALRPYRDSLENGSWAVGLIRRSSEMPVMPYAIFTRYAVMVHNTLRKMYSFPTKRPPLTRRRLSQPCLHLPRPPVSVTAQRSTRRNRRFSEWSAEAISITRAP